MWNISQFHEVAPRDAMGILADLDKVDLVPLFEANPWDGKVVGTALLEDDEGNNYSASMKPTPKVWGIKNLNSGVVHFGASEGYAPLNHEEAFTPVLTALDNLNLPTMMSLENHGDVVELFALFPDLIVNDHADGIMMGVRFKNVYNDKKSFKGTAFGWRVRCMNGSLHSVIFQDLKIAAWHTERQVLEIPVKIENFVEGILQRSHLFERTIDDAIKAELNFKDYAEIANTLAPVTDSQAIATVAAQQIDDPAKTNKWELYNAITAYASHEPISFNTRERIVSSAEKNILFGKNFAPIPVPVVA